MSVETLAVGKWLLLGADADPGDTPVHGVKLVFHQDTTGIRGAIVNWASGEEIPLAWVQFDGSTLRLQMQQDEASRAVFKSEPPILMMRVVNDHFEGSWTNAIGANTGRPSTPVLKLVPYCN